MKIRHLITLAALFCATQASAVPAKPGTWRNIQLTDGTTVHAELCGDEFCRFWRSAEGKVYTLSEGSKYSRAEKADIEQKGNALRSRANAERMSRAADGRSGKYTGKKRGLIILVEFAAKSSQGIPAKTFSTPNAQEYYNRVANEKGFTDATGFKGSVYDYFYAQSYGQFEFNFDVVGPFKLPNVYSFYGGNDATGNEANVGQLVYDACRYADAKSDVDFSKYDWDGDGTVDQIFVLYAGQGENTNPEEPGLIWPQEGTLGSVGMNQQPFNEFDNVWIKTFACSSELGEGGKIDGIGTICHEFSHCFGLPDTYDKGTSFGQTSIKYGTYIWDLMNMGNYLDGGFQPAGYTALERSLCGWMTLTELKESATISEMKPLSEKGEAYVIYNDGHRDEFYILENRQKKGCDAGLYASGLMISHVDYSEEAWKNNDVNTTKERCGIIAADNSWERTEKDVCGDLYPYNGNNALTATTIPAATVNHKNSDGSLLMQKEVRDITQNADGTISFTFYNPMPSAIQQITIEDGERQGGTYTLSGQRIDKDAAKHGVYIYNKRKIIK